MAPSGTALTASPEAKRIAALDALRGVAVAGIVPMNVIAFAMPASAYVNPRSFGLESGLDAALWALSFVFIEDKFRTLFAMLFGAGVAILLERAQGHAGARPLAGHYARMAALLVIALAHAIVLANNDVLRSYAVVGLALPLVVGWPARRLLMAAAAIIAAQLLVSLYFAWDWLLVWWDGTNSAALAEAERLFGADSHAIAGALERGQESFGERLTRRLADPALQVRAVAASIPSTLAAMLIGVALWRSGLLAGSWPAPRALALAARLAMIALPFLIAMGAWSMASGYSPIVTAVNALVLSAPFDILLGIAYAAIAMAMFEEGTWASRWAAVGRLALTNYLATSVIFASLFASWGLGLFGEVNRAQALALGLVPVAAMLIWSPLWLARHQRGPAEWLWRSMAAGRPV